MISLSELKRRLENIVQIGSVHEAKIIEGHHLARVVLDDDGINKRVSPFLPIKSLANSFGKAFFPVRSGEQVIVISPFGNINGGFIIRSIFHNKCKVPTGANEHTTVIEFEDGTKMFYDSKASKLEVDAVKTINIYCVDVNVEASKQAYVKAPNTIIESKTLVKGTLTVEGLTSLLGGMKVIPSEGVTIGAEFDCDIKTTKNISADGEISDKKGSLTNHTNNGYLRD
ncbi:baseplate assembly protein [Malaciobacter mytili LMG 24559]|uniref:Baseplate assembly protein n=1 Tax=Malaciobacter mytili LMG 24559 TaxID=1032238 RepID=A0AAX2AGC5_9BACT|nr:phage baseplate assembly protein V [Malaciobacter mytili]AXH14372.1 phage baseplate assembly protein V [Malaciobacter mytili LMG 24559]RXK16052.1 baseplate assembly protein [Malaciobacter mytili LMG 24559]